MAPDIMSLCTEDSSDFEFDDEKLESELESDESPKWATLSLIVVFILGIMGIHFTCIVLNYIICFYRFIMVWNQIFRINRVERQFAAPLRQRPFHVCLNVRLKNLS